MLFSPCFLCVSISSPDLSVHISRTPCLRVLPLTRETQPHLFPPTCCHPCPRYFTCLHVEVHHGHSSYVMFYCILPHGNVYFQFLKTHCSICIRQMRVVPTPIGSLTWEFTCDPMCRMVVEISQGIRHMLGLHPRH